MKRVPPISLMGTDSKEVAEGNGNFYFSFIYVCRPSSWERRKEKIKQLVKKYICYIWFFSNRRLLEYQKYKISPSIIIVKIKIYMHKVERIYFIIFCIISCIISCIIFVIYIQIIISIILYNVIILYFVKPGNREKERGRKTDSQYRDFPSAFALNACWYIYKCKSLYPHFAFTGVATVQSAIRSN